MNKQPRFATSPNSIISLDLRKHSTWFWYSGVFLLIGLFSLSLALPFSTQAAATAPNSPSGLYKSGSTATSITMNWTDNSTQETGFRIYRNGSLYAEVGANVTSYTDSGLACGASYSYYVTAINSVSVPPPPSFSGTSGSVGFNLSGGTTSTVGISLASTQALTATTCGTATGDTTLTLKLGGSTVAYSDDACGLLSNLTYTNSSGVANNYSLITACYGGGACSGTMYYSTTSSGPIAMEKSRSSVAQAVNWFSKELGLVKPVAAQTIYESGASNTITAGTNACPDVTPPTNPTSLSVTGSPCYGSLTCTSTTPALTYSWNAGSDSGSGIAGYQVLFQDSTNSAWIASAIVGNVLSTSISPSGLVDGRTYYTWVRAYDNAGNWNGVFKQGTSVTIYLPPAPPPPVLNGDFTITNSSTAGVVSMAWAYFSSLADNFNIYRNGSYIGSKVANYPTTSSYNYNDTGCPVAGNYTYQIYATGPTGTATRAPSQSTYKHACDVTPPSGTIIINQGNLLTGSTTVNLEITCTDGDSGCNTYSVYTNDSCGGSPIKSGTTVYGDLVTATLPISGHTMYASVSLTDYSGNTACYSDAIYYDVTPPTGTISINNGAATTSSTSVNLSLNCADNSSSFAANPLAIKTNDSGNQVATKITSKWLSWLAPVIDWLGFNKVAQALPSGPNKLGCEMMQFSNDGSTWSIQETYAASKTWTLSACANNRTVYVKYYDSVGNASPAYAGTITCDNTAPVAGVCGLNPSGWTSGSVTGTVTFTDAGVGPASQTATCTINTNGGSCSVSATDSLGNGPTSQTCGPAYIDTTAPTNPNSLSVTGSQCSGGTCTSTTPTLTYSWNAASDTQSGVGGYQIVLQEGDAGYYPTWVTSAVVGNINSTTITPTLTNGRSYKTWVRAYDNAGNWNGVFFQGNDIVIQTQYTHYSYSAWSACANFGAWDTTTHTRTGTQTRTYSSYTNSTPPNDTLGALRQSCTETDIAGPTFGTATKSIVSQNFDSVNATVGNKRYSAVTSSVAAGILDSTALNSKANDPEFTVSVPISSLSGISGNPICNFFDARLGTLQNGNCSISGNMVTATYQRNYGQNNSLDYYMSITVTDNAGNSKPSPNYMFSVSNSAPSIIQVK